MPRTRNQSRKKQNARARPQRYTQDEKIKAVTILVGMGGMSPESHRQAEIALNRKINYQTLACWQTELKSKIIESTPELAPKELDVPKIIAETRRDLLVNLSESIGKLSKSVNDQDAIDKASLRDRYVSLGIGTDKLLIVAGRSPELDNLLQAFIKECEGTTFNPQSLLESLVNAVKAKKQALLAESSDIIDGEIITEQIS